MSYNTIITIAQNQPFPGITKIMPQKFICMFFDTVDGSFFLYIYQPDTNTLFNNLI